MKVRTILSTCLLSLVLLAAFPASAVVILSEDFEGGIPGDWSSVDDAGNGVDWRTSTDWGEGNYTNGSGEAAMICSDCFGSADHDGSLITETFSLNGFSAAFISYTANYQNFAAQDFLDVDITNDGGLSWTTLLSWNEDHGGFFAAPGEDVTLDLSAYLGQSMLNLRWRNYEPTTPDFNWYAQIDDVLIEGTATAVPEPATLGLLGAGLIGLGLARRRRV